MCGAISVKCKTEGCNGMARYSLYCYSCDKGDLRLNLILEKD